MRLAPVAGALLLSVAALIAANKEADDSVLIRHVIVHPVTSPAIASGSVLVVHGRIRAVGSGTGASGARVVDGQGLDLYPGLINAGTNIGLQEIAALRDTVDLDEIGLFNPQLIAEHAFNPSSEHIPVLRAAGVTTVLTLPSSGATRQSPNQPPPPILAGQGALMHLDGWTWDEMAVRGGAVVDMIFPQIDKPSPQTQALFGSAPRGFPELDREYRQRLLETDRFFEAARRYRQAKLAGGAGFQPDVKLEAMLPVIEGKRPLLIRASRERSIRDAIAFADRQKVRVILAEPRDLGDTAKLIKQRNIPVVLGDVLALPLRDDDPYDSQYALPAELFRAGIKLCFGTFDTQFARNVPFQAGAAVGFGLPHDEAIKALTINAAEILGVGTELGSIEPGKIADLMLTDGDPLEAKTHIRQVFIAGKQVDLESRQTRLYDKYLHRP